MSKITFVVAFVFNFLHLVPKIDKQASIYNHRNVDDAFDSVYCSVMFRLWSMHVNCAVFDRVEIQFIQVWMI